MKNKFLSFLMVVALFVISLNSGCRYDAHLPEVVDPGVEVKFSADIIPIFNESCNYSGCHGFGEVPPDLSPNNAYDALINGGYINVDDPEKSELYQWVRGNRSLPMPLTGTDPVIYSTILAWIEQGAQNN